MAAWLSFPRLGWPWIRPDMWESILIPRTNPQQSQPPFNRPVTDQRVLLPLHGLGVLYGHLLDAGGASWFFQGWDIGTHGMAVFSGQRLELSPDAAVTVVLHGSEGQAIQEIPAVLCWVDLNRHSFCFAGLEFLKPLANDSYGARFLRPGVHHLY